MRELGPCCVVSALGELMVAHHVQYRQVSDREHVILIDEPAALLMREVAAPPADAFVPPCHHPPSALPLPLPQRRTLSRSLTGQRPHLVSFRGVQIGLLATNLRSERRSQGFMNIEGYLVFALGFSQRPLLLAQEVRVRDWITLSRHSADFQAHIDAHHLPNRG